MSAHNQISIEIPAAVIESVKQKLQQCRAELAPYLQGLTLAERGSMFKMGNRTVVNVQKTKSYVETNPEFVPKYMDQAEFLKDEAVVTQLSPLENLANQLSADLRDTVMLAGSEALQSAMLYYGQVREASNRGVPAAKPIYEDLSELFSRRAKKAKESK
jgi:hypothetical protein